MNTLLTTNHSGEVVSLNDVAFVRSRSRIVLIETPNEITLEQMSEPFQQSLMLVPRNSVDGRLSIDAESGDEIAAQIPDLAAHLVGEEIIGVDQSHRNHLLKNGLP
jgi:hypothetical protein